MDAFRTHNQVISEYRSYLESFLNISDDRIKAEVEKAFKEEGFIPQPLIQFNPSFQRDQSLQDLVSQGIVHKNLPGTFGDFKLYKHQIEAIKKGVNDKGFIVTSGTGSGKSLTFLATIFNHVFNFGESKPTGIKAILVYPMNALLNSQEQEIKKYQEEYQMKFGEDFPVTFGKYSGQEGSSTREEIKKNPPDIILTNYMMLELIMTRQGEGWLRDSLSESLKYIVFDELHTYRGRQGSDVSMLIRRIKGICENDLICIGTSATMASVGTVEEKKEAVAKVAKTIFSEDYSGKQIVNEYLETCTRGETPDASILKTYLENEIPQGDEAAFIANPLSNWIETEIALKLNGDVLERGTPMTIDAITKKLSDYTRVEFEVAKDKVSILLKWAEKLNEDNRQRKTNQSFLPFRFHQFISQTSNVSVTLNSRAERYITIQSNRYVKDGDQEKLLYPILFSRFSGIDFICVEKDVQGRTLMPRNPKDFVRTLTKKEGKGEALNEYNFRNGYIVLDEGEGFWEDDPLEIVPESWLRKNQTSLLPFYQWHMPQPIYFDEEGNYSDKPGYPIKGYFIPVKLRIDPTAGIIYEDAKTNENTKLMSLGNEGRSTATTITSFAVINSLFEQGENAKDQKLLSFTDNRQDASLQAGHFNDFISTIKLRAALYITIQQAGDSLNIENIAGKVLEVLKLKEIDFANPNFMSGDPDFPELENIRAIKNYILYRLFQDLKRGWRYTLPNLEQTALLKIEYFRLEKLASLDDRFANIPLFNAVSEQERFSMLEQFLNFFRTNFSMYHNILVDNRSEVESLLQNRLDNKKLWSLDHNEKLDSPTYLVSRSPGRARQRGVYFASIGVRSGIGKYFKRKFSEANIEKPNLDEYTDFIEQLCELLVSTGFLTKNENIRGANGTVTGYLLRSDNLQWKPGDKVTVPVDETRTNSYKEQDIKPNMYFQKLYTNNFSKYDKEIIGREHTGQLNNEDRIEREDDFREGKISSLFCSPTMELGIDIANLNIVHMRNVPPNPANYAQRSGRAGRGGQTALVFTYCSGWSPHDQNYFKASETMVAGSVVPPRIDLINEELIASHLNAIILMELSIGELSTSIAELLDISNEVELELKQRIKDHIDHGIELNKEKWIKNFKRVVSSINEDLSSAWWYSDDWIERRLLSFKDTFDAAFDRWRNLYRTAKKMNASAHIVLNDPHIRKEDNEKYKDALRQYHIALKQIELLTNQSNREFGGESEFYVFRYLASEGFLPGYNFTRLPIRTFLGYKHKNEGEFISRPRSVAIKEFGPGNTIYHNGSKYAINRMPVLDSEQFQQKIKISKDTGYVFLNQDAETANNDPITKEELRGDNFDFRTNLVELMDSEGVPRERISCVEEERISRGFDVQEFFRYNSGIEHTKKVIIKNAGEPLLNLIFGQATELIKINRKARRSSEDTDGFAIDQRNGKWLAQKDLENEEVKNNKKDIMLFVRENADTIYIQPLDSLGLSADKIITLSYALKRGIEKLFQVEEQEIGVSIMGDRENPNLMIYEAAEGSLGILSQLIEEPTKLNELFVQAYSSMHFNPENREETEYGKTLPKATYEDLLSYYNQRNHDILDRHSIKAALEQLMDCEVSTVQNGKDYEEQYQLLLESYDKNSNTELQLIRYLYKHKLALPDKAQVNVPECYVNADFVYNTENGATLIFCDGNVHDLPGVSDTDYEKRRCVRDAGYDVIEWHHTEPIEDLVKRRKDIFKKVK
ncbi:DEAD/DEAH box helicase [Aequorivita sinensis]|uniref:DEAD/DEAH box helicase n=1 Tax=Aequorivita sinensis TaxID=1382458 RepID=UPI00230084FC|nr:DEAD/DEAH box helicase [Aequorivita sinensis]